MEITEIWSLLGSHIHQDFLLDYPDFFSGISEIVGDFTPLQREELRIFLSELTDGERTNTELFEVWRKSGAEFFVCKEQTKEFLSEILSMLQSK